MTYLKVFLIFIFIFIFLFCFCNKSENNSLNNLEDNKTDNVSTNTGTEHNSTVIDNPCENSVAAECLKEVKDIDTLDKLSLFTFAVFSDNKGDGPEDHEFMNGMAKGVENMKAEFVIGVGDHLRGQSDNPSQKFLSFIKNNDWWSKNFYPVIADGENNYYGTAQSDWGAGSKLNDEIHVCERENTVCKDNHAEYHAVFNIKGIEIHFITVHYPDAGDDRFPESSKLYLLNELAQIEEKENQIIIAAAHTGNWLKDFEEIQQEIILKKADLLLGATTHIYKRYNYSNDLALFLNSGAVGYAIFFNNYLQVNVISSPLRIVVQNMKSDEYERQLHIDNNCWIKEIGKEVSPCDLVNGKEWPLSDWQKEE